MKTNVDKIITNNNKDYTSASPAMLELKLRMDFPSTHPANV